MRRITFNADEVLIERARDAARQRGTSLDAAFREWLESYVASATHRIDFPELMQRLKHVRSDGPYSRDEMNAR